MSVTIDKTGPNHPYPNPLAIFFDSIHNRPAWHHQALCAEADPELWFPEKGKSNVEAKRICGRCPVKTQCLHDAVERGEPYGVRGGLSEHERRRYKPVTGDEPGYDEITVQQVMAGSLRVGVTRADKAARVEAIRRLTTAGHSTTAIATRLGITERTVNRARVQHGAAPGSNHRARTNSRRPSTPWVAALAAAQVIATELTGEGRAVSRAALTRRLRAAGHTCSSHRATALLKHLRGEQPEHGSVSNDAA